MTMLKHVTLLMILFVWKCSAGDLTHGKVTAGDLLLHEGTYTRRPIWLTIRSSDVAFPQYYESHKYIIHGIKVTDNMKSGDEGFAEVDYGGYGYSYANVHLRSQRGKGFNFTIEIYGVPK